MCIHKARKIEKKKQIDQWQMKQQQQQVMTKVRQYLVVVVVCTVGTNFGIIFSFSTPPEKKS